MIKLIKYDLKGIVISKKYFYINLILAIITLRAVNGVLVISKFKGVISPWTYAQFIVGMNSFLMTIIAILSVGIFSNSEKRVKNILFSTKLSERGYYFLKQISILIAATISLIIVIIVSFGWYGYYLKFSDFSKFLYPVVIYVFPAIVLVLGLAINIGRLSEKLLYLFIPLIFIGTSLNLNLPPFIDIAGNNNITQLLFMSGDEFSLPYSFMLSRIIMLLLGIILIGIACRKSKM